MKIPINGFENSKIRFNSEGEGFTLTKQSRNKVSRERFYLE